MLNENTEYFIQVSDSSTEESSGKHTTHNSSSSGEKTSELDAQQLLVHNAILALPGFNSDTKLPEKIRKLFKKNPNATVESILDDLISSDPKKIVNLILRKDPYSQYENIRTWWTDQKNVMTSRYSQNNTSLPNQDTQSNLEIFKSYFGYEANLVKELKKSLIEYAKENFYIYKSGKSYYYSPFPNDKSLGFRCDKDGGPLKDKNGTKLTTDTGEVIYGITTVTIIRDRPITTQTEASKGDEGATPYTDKEGLPLFAKYENIINNQKPKNISRDRTKALNDLLYVIDNLSAHDIYQYLCTTSFQKLMGAEEKSIQFWKTTFHRICKTFEVNYKTFREKTSDSALLSILLNEDMFQSLSEDDIKNLFWNYNSKLVADVYVNLYRNGNNSFEELLCQNKKTTRIFNEKRCKQKSTLLLPNNFCIPGINALEEDSLTKLELFQYEEKTIAALEQILRTTFSNLIINSSANPAKSILYKNAPYYFYLIPANAYMLIDPDLTKDPNYYRFEQFKNDLPCLINDSKVDNFDKPIIFCGIINVGGNHYIPYFIHKSATKISVFTVDSSPTLYPSMHENRDDDPKEKVRKRVSKSFSAILPGCKVYDAKVTQMLRDRDCGPNSGQTLFDALSSALTKAQLLTIQDGTLKLDPSQLTIGVQAIGVNPYSKTFIYPHEIKTKTSQNRKLWEICLSDVKQVVFYSRSSKHAKSPLSITDEYELLIDEYNYLNLVESQVMHDKYYEYISSIQAFLLGDEKGKSLLDNAIHKYKETLQFGDLKPLLEWVTSKLNFAQLEEYTDKTILSLIEDALILNLREEIQFILFDLLNKEVLTELKSGLYLNPEDIMNDFLKKNPAMLDKLPPHQQVSIKMFLRGKIAEITTKKIKEHSCTVLINLFKRNCLRYLTSIETINITQEKDSEHLFAEYLYNGILRDSIKLQDLENKFNDTDIKTAIFCLRIHAPDDLKHIIQHEVTSTISRELSSKIIEARNKFSFEKKPLKELATKYLDANGNMVLYTEVFLCEEWLLEGITPAVFNKQNFYSWLLNQINKVYSYQFKKCLSEEIDTRSELLNDSITTFFCCNKMSLPDIFKVLNSDDKAEHLREGDILNFLKRHGSKATFTFELYQRSPGLKTYIRSSLNRLYINSLTARADSIFKDLASTIVEQIKQTPSLTFEYEKFQKQYNPENTTTLAEGILQAAKKNSNTVRSLFSTNFTLITDDKNIIEDYFKEYFTKHSLAWIFKNYQAVDAVAARIKHVISIVQRLAQADFLGTFMNSYSLDSLNSTLGKLNELSLLTPDRLPPNLAEHTKVFFEEIKQIAKLLLTHPGYVKGETKAATITTKIRPLICSFLNLEAPRVLTRITAKEIDERLFYLASQNQNSQYNYKDSQLLEVISIDTLPQTYNKILTIKLLVDLYFYWDQHHPFMFPTAVLPPIVSEIIQIINNAPDISSPVSDEQFARLLRSMQKKSSMEKLSLFHEKDATSQICTAILNSKNYTSELKPTLITFALLEKAIAGEDSSVELKEAIQPILIKEADFEKLVDEKLKEASENVSSEAHSRNSSGSNSSNSSSSATQQASIDDRIVSRDEIKKQLLRRYAIQGNKPILMRSEFNAKVTAKYLEHVSKIRATQEEIRKLFIEDRLKNGVSAEMAEKEADEINPIPTEKKEDIAKELRNDFDVIEDNDQKTTPNLQSVPPGQLQREGFQKFSLFGDTDLNKLITLMKGRHIPGDERLDNADMEQLRLHLSKRWNNLLSIEGGSAVYKHYMAEKPNYVDSQYILVAGLLAQFYSQQEKPFCKYELLMPGYFPPSANLENPTKMYKCPATIDDIALEDLLFINNKYALSMQHIIWRYETRKVLTNPYTDLPFTSAELDIILSHPKVQKLIDVVNPRPNVTSRSIDLLEAYVKGTVFQEGFIQEYGHNHQKASEATAKHFWEEFKKLGQDEQQALMDEPIPNSSRTVREVFRESDNQCITYGGLSLASVVYSYKRTNHTLPRFIVQKLLRDLPQKDFLEAHEKTAQERYLLEHGTQTKLAFTSL